MTPEQRDGIIDGFCEGSSDQIDETVKLRLQDLKGRSNEDIKDELLGIIDDCVYASLTSGFTLRALDILWKGCGGSNQELQERNRLLQDDAKIEELRHRYKWKSR